VDAAPVAVEVDPAQPDHPARLDDQETQEAQALQDNPANLRPRLAQPSSNSHANSAPAVSPDHPAHPDPMETPAVQDSQARAAAAHSQAHQDHPARQDPMEDPATQEVQDNQDSQEPAQEVEPELQDQPETLVAQDSQEATDSQDSPADQDKPDPRDHPAVPASPVPTVTPASPEPPASQAVEARRESAPSTAPSMEESSSRTELDAVKHFSLSIPIHCPIVFPEIPTPIIMVLLPLPFASFLP